MPKFKILLFTIFLALPTVQGAHNPYQIMTDFNKDGILDRILIYDKTGNHSETYNFEDEIWVFDSKNDGTAELIIEFSSKNSKLVAYLYDDVDGDKNVSYSFNGTGVKITESEYPRVTVVAEEDNFWIKEGKINYNIGIYVDGSIEARIGSRFDPIPKPDGNIDTEMHVIDVDQDYNPDYEFLASNLSEGKIGNYLNVNADRKKKGIKDYIFWPYLGSGHGYWMRGPNKAPAPIQVDWKNAKIRYITEVVASRGVEGNYFVQSAINIFKNKVNILSGENPFAYYDLANDSDDMPELIVRMVDDGSWAWVNHQPGYELDGLGSYNTIRYSWDQNNDGGLDYDITLVGTNKFNTTVEYPGFSIQHMPYERIPYWVFDQTWTAAIFNVDEKSSYRSDEGIYGSWIEHWLKGGTVEDWGKYQGINLPGKILPNRIGMKLEIYTNKTKIPRLYFSPVDRRLHLLNAEQGMWVISVKGREYLGEFAQQEYATGNVTTNEKIEYQNLNNDRYVDKWTYFLNNQPIKHLIYDNRGFLIYSDRKQTRWMKTFINESLFETFPPRNSSEWNELNNKLEIYGKNIDGRNFEAMFEQFYGDTTNIKNGFLSDFRRTKRGFWFILDCELDCGVDSIAKVGYEKPFTKGKYLFVYDGNFLVRKLDEPEFIISPEDIKFSNTTPTELQYVVITANIYYVGVADTGPVSVQFFDGNPREGGVWIGNWTIPNIAAGEIEAASAKWSTIAGSHDIYVAIDAAVKEKKISKMASKSIEVFAAAKPSTFEKLMMGGGKMNLIYLSLLLIGMLGVALLILRFIFEF